MDDLFSVAGKVALVTGGTRGIGLMIATGLVEAGARVYVSSRHAEVCEEVAAELSRVGDCRAVPADLSTEVACRTLAEAVVSEEGGRLDILVNNAGNNWAAPLADYDDAAWERVLALNLKAPFQLVRFLRPALEAAAQAGGEPSRVVNIGSIDGLHVPPFETYAYSASKAALHQLTAVLARQLAPLVTVNAVAPGPFESKMMASTLRSMGDQIVASCPLGRIGRPADMAGVTLFLASRAGAYVTGAVIPVDGGIATTR